MAGPRVAVLDYGIGNLRSAQKSLNRAGADAVLTADADFIAAAAGVVLPGVGAFGASMRALVETGLADQALLAVKSGRPFLGVCVGMQMLYEGSEEAEGISGLGVLPGMVRLLPDGVKRPQMQWNRLNVRQPVHSLLEDLDQSWMYFVHSYAPEITKHTIASADYGGDIVAAAAKGNVSATQFHPEKSADSGKKLLQNWVGSLDPLATSDQALL